MCVIKVDVTHSALPLNCERLLVSFRDQWKEWGHSNFQNCTELPIPPHEAVVIEQLIVFF